MDNIEEKIGNSEKVENALYNILCAYYQKNKKLPSFGRFMVHRRLIHNNDMVDYSIDKKGIYIKVSYMYYNDMYNENIYTSSSFTIK